MEKSTNGKGIKAIADEIFGITFKERIKEALNGISEEELKNLKKTAKGRQIVRDIERIRKEDGK